MFVIVKYCYVYYVGVSSALDGQRNTPSSFMCRNNMNEYVSFSNIVFCHMNTYHFIKKLLIEVTLKLFKNHPQKSFYLAACIVPFALFHLIISSSIFFFNILLINFEFLYYIILYCSFHKWSFVFYQLQQQFAHKWCYPNANGGAKKTPRAIGGEPKFLYHNISNRV